MCKKKREDSSFKLLEEKVASSKVNKNTNVCRMKMTRRRKKMQAVLSAFNFWRR